MRHRMFFGRSCEEIGDSAAARSDHSGGSGKLSTSMMMTQTDHSTAGALPGTAAAA